jgi:hypothetical protein
LPDGKLLAKQLPFGGRLWRTKHGYFPLGHLAFAYGAGKLLAKQLEG